MLPFLKAPADAPLMTDKHEIDARYRYWRRHILLTIWLGYALFYFTRKSFNAAVPEILANGVLSRSDIGLLATLFYITYGVSKFVSGIVSDRSNARYFMGIGLIATGIINILFGFSTSLWAFAVLWVLNAFFQGWGSPVCARLLTAWYSRTERGGWWALWNTAHNVGGALIPIVMAASALHYGWRAGMMIAGCMAIVVGIFLCWRLRDRPQALGLPAVGEWRHDALEIAQQQEGAGLTRKEILTKYVLLNPYIWLLSFCYVLVYVVHGGGRVFPQRGGRGGDGICRLVCLSWCVACWLAAGESTRYLALERIFCGYRHRRRDFRTAITALFERPDTARSVMHLTFSLHIRQN